VSDIERSRGNWYQDLIQDIKRLECTGIVVTKHAIGQRILADFEKFGKPEYGSNQIGGLAKDADISKTDVYNCVKFARKYPELSNTVGKLSWRTIVGELCEQPRGKTEKSAPDPSVMVRRVEAYLDKFDDDAQRLEAARYLAKELERMSVTYAEKGQQPFDWEDQSTKGMTDRKLSASEERSQRKLFAD
jgi:hypothetical protein